MEVMIDIAGERHERHSGNEKKRKKKEKAQATYLSMWDRNFMLVQ